MIIKIKERMILKSSDGEYVYNIYSYSSHNRTMIVDVLNRNLETITSRTWEVEDFEKQIEAGTIVPFQEGEVIGD